MPAVALATLNPSLLLGAVCASLVWMALGYRSHRAHRDRRRLPTWELAAEYLVALTALYCLVQLGVQQLHL